jgi:hypothetical protein
LYIFGYPWFQEYQSPRRQMLLINNQVITISVDLLTRPLACLAAGLRVISVDADAHYIFKNAFSKQYYVIAVSLLIAKCYDSRDCLRHYLRHVGFFHCCFICCGKRSLLFSVISSFCVVIRSFDCWLYIPPFHKNRNAAIFVGKLGCVTR